jgi:N-methylhydantoinase B
VAHHLDLGGGAPGLNPDARDVYQEGIIFPPSKYNMSHDWNGGPLERLVRANIRVPDQTIGDFNAQFAANSIGGERVKELCGRFGAGTVAQAMAELLDYSERRMRAAIAELPDGIYSGEDFMDDDGLSDEPLRVQATVEIRGDTVIVDYEGTCDQVKSNVNCPFASTVAAGLSCVKAVLTSPDIPFNEGSKRPIIVKAPLGSLLNPRRPAPVRARMLSAYRAYNAAMKALSHAAPEKVIAAGFDSTEVLVLSKLRDSGYSIYLEIFGGGYGANFLGDGCDAVDSPLSNCGNVPIEAMDMEYDFFRVEEYGLRSGSGGDGRHRGGLGMVRRYRILEDEVTFATYSDRFRIPPEGLFGGKEGACAATHVERDGEIIDLPSKTSFALRKGDLLVAHTGGGAGYGNPAERSQNDRARDLREGFVAPGEALMSGEAAE